MSETGGSGKKASDEASRAGRGGIIPPVEHRFPPGQSGNPSGRPKCGRLVSTALAELQDTPGKTIAAVIAAFKKSRGNFLCGADHKAIALFRTECAARERTQVSAAALSLDRLEGKVTQGIDVSGTLDLADVIAAANAAIVSGGGSES